MSEGKTERHDPVLVMIGAATAMIEVLGELTGREVEAVALIGVVRETFTER